MLTLRVFSADRKLGTASPGAQLVQLQVFDLNDLGDADTAIKRAGAEEAQLSTDVVPERLTTSFVTLGLSFGSGMEGDCAVLNI